MSASAESISTEFVEYSRPSGLPQHLHRTIFVVDRAAYGILLVGKKGFWTRDAMEEYCDGLKRSWFKWEPMVRAFPVSRPVPLTWDAEAEREAAALLNVKMADVWYPESLQALGGRTR